MLVSANITLKTEYHFKNQNIGLKPELSVFL